LIYFFKRYWRYKNSYTFKY